MENVYAFLAGALSHIQDGGSLPMGGWTFGKVLAAGGGTLRVSVGGLTLEAGDIHVPAALSYTWTEDTGGDGLLRAGDQLLLLVTQDRQDYYILQKVVWQT